MPHSFKVHQFKEQLFNDKADMTWIYCAKCGEYMNNPVADRQSGKVYHKWCLPNNDKGES